MHDALAVSGFSELSLEEAVALNGGWGFWSLVGMVEKGWCKLFAVAGIAIEFAFGDYGDGIGDYEYYWGED